MLVSPSSPVPIPKDIAKARTEALNSVTQAEAEYRRLVELQVAKEMEIVELVKRKIYEEEQFEKVSKDLKSVTESVTKLMAEEAHLRAEIALHKELIVKGDKELKDRENKCLEKENELNQRETSLLTRENIYSVKSDELQQQIFIHNTNVDILTKAIKSCSIQA